MEKIITNSGVEISIPAEYQMDDGTCPVCQLTQKLYLISALPSYDWQCLWVCEACIKTMMSPFQFITNCTRCGVPLAKRFPYPTDSEVKVQEQLCWGCNEKQTIEDIANQRIVEFEKNKEKGVRSK